MWQAGAPPLSSRLLCSVGTIAWHPGRYANVTSIASLLSGRPQRGSPVAATSASAAGARRACQQRCRTGASRPAAAALHPAPAVPRRGAAGGAGAVARADAAWPAAVPAHHTQPALPSVRGHRQIDMRRLQVGPGRSRHVRGGSHGTFPMIAAGRLAALHLPAHTRISHCRPGKCTLRLCFIWSTLIAASCCISPLLLQRQGAAELSRGGHAATRGVAPMVRPFLACL